MPEQTTLMTWMNEGGWVMWILLGFSLATVTVAVQRWLVFRRALRPAETVLISVRDTLARAPGDRAAAARRANEHTGAVARLVESGLRRTESDPERFERYLEGIALGHLRRLRRGLPILASTAVTAPLIGFLGTVTGMMASFEALAEFGISDPTMVALGIKEALTTTAAGLIVAVPAQLLLQYFSSRLTHLESELETAGNFLLDLERVESG